MVEKGDTMFTLRRMAVVAATCSGLAALAVPAAVAGPHGNGLYTEHHSTCTFPDGTIWTGNVTLLPDPSNGVSFWANGIHLVIKSGFTATSDNATDGDWFIVGKGQKTGSITKPMVRCHGYFPDSGIWVTSFSIPKP